jgi:hypothetical protein
MPKWVGRTFTNARSGFRKFVGVRIASDITEKERDIFESYGEQTISTMLAGGLPPSTQDLRDIYISEFAKRHARDWLTEVADLREFKDRWVSGRDLFLELVVIALIGWEIFMGYQQERMQSKNFIDQQRILKDMEESSKATAGTLASLKSTTEIMNQSVQRSAAAMEANAATASQTLHLSERAYLTCAVSLVAPLKTGEKFHAIADVLNAGKGLAIDVVTVTYMAQVPKRITPEIAHETAVGKPLSASKSKRPLAAGQLVHQIVDSAFDLTDNDLADIENGSINIYVFVDGNYKDSFGHSHELKSCSYYYPPQKVLAICPTMNKAD